MSKADQRRYRYVTPARPEGTNERTQMADCWIVDKDGNRNPGTGVSPIPVSLGALGRRVA